MKNILVVIILCATISCNNNSFETFKKFPDETHLKHELIKTPAVLNYVGEIVLLNNIVLTLDMKADTFFQAFQYPNFKYIGGFISRGNGPKEEIFIYPFFRQIDKNTILYNTPKNIKTAVFDTVNEEIKILKEIELPSNMASLQQVFCLNKTLFGWKLEGSQNREFIKIKYKRKTTTINFGPSFPSLKEKVPPEMKNLVFGKIITVKPDKTLFASVYDKFPILRIYNTDGSLNKELRFSNGQSFPHALIQKSSSQSDFYNIMQNYRKIKSTDNYIYALYIGKVNKEIGEEMGDDSSNEIHVWDWQGNPVKKVILDKKIFSFIVTSNDEYLICSSVRNIDSFYRYPLSWN